MKNTVKDFRDLGLYFVVGDKVIDKSTDGTGAEYKLNHPDMSLINKGDECYKNDIVVELEWRDNTGEEPSFRGEVEYEFMDGDTGDCTDPNELRWRKINSDSDIAKWRPVLSQPEEEGIYSGTKQEPKGNPGIEEIAKFINERSIPLEDLSIADFCIKCIAEYKGISIDKKKDDKVKSVCLSLGASFGKDSEYGLIPNVISELYDMGLLSE